jgi:hypothetical protein
MSKYSNHKKNKIPFLICLLCFWLVACFFYACNPRSEIKNEKAGFEIKEFNPLKNIDTTANINGIIQIFLDYSDAIDGFTIPSQQQLSGNGFVYSFQIKNTGLTPKKFFYKIYYQNESYKFPEIEQDDSSRQHPYAHENFYGSWENNKEGFRETPEIPADGKFHEVTGTFRIRGNPRDEQLFFASNVNEYWKRNPRTGKYSFLLTVVNADADKSNIPAYMVDLSAIADSSYINPYYYFLFGPGKDNPMVLKLSSTDTLFVKAQIPLDAGIYISPANFDSAKNSQYFLSRCGQNSHLYKTAVFNQFIHFIDSSSAFENIPVVDDVLNGDYTLTDYNWDKAFHSKDEMVRIMPQIAECPCEEINVDTNKQSVSIINKATTWGKWEKQNIGIITRHGFSYGTYTVKVKLTELLNKYGMWDGLTNAIWLITQSPESWNARRSCENQGYIPDYYGGGKNAKRASKISYSEIDFEILKTDPYCPEYIYPPAYAHPLANPYNVANWNIPYPEDGENSKDQIMVCCTNWDMACPQPENFDVGCQDVKSPYGIFQAHRWDNWYKAITEKTPASDDALFGSKYYYFQIIWKPEEIIWKIGPEKDKLQTVGYMNSTMTSIPNNQMLLVISQEFHSTAWWPGSPFLQSNIPFPAADLKGEVFEITIE